MKKMGDLLQNLSLQSKKYQKAESQKSLCQKKLEDITESNLSSEGKEKQNKSYRPPFWTNPVDKSLENLRNLMLSDKSQIIQTFFNSIVPKKYHKIKEFKRINWKIIDQYAGKSVFIHGDTGTGKTSYMCAFIYKLLEKNPRERIKFLPYSNFIIEIGDTFGTGNTYAFIQEVANFQGWLCIDDLGAERLTDWTRQITYSIINTREQQELPLLITSNYSLEELSEYIDHRIASRIMGICEILEIKGEDVRLEL